MAIPRALVVLLPVVVVIGAVVVLVPRRQTEQAEPATPSQPRTEVASPAGAPDEVVISPEQIINEVRMQELQYLPEDVTIGADAHSAVLRSHATRRGAQRLANLRKLTDRARDGDFMAPRISPDGMQVLVTRPGFQGVFLMPINGGEPVHLADGNAFKARWTADGRIEIPGEDGMIRRYGPDGTLESAFPRDPASELAFADNDVIMARPAPGAAPVPITGNDDRYFNPVVSPDGTKVVYEGLQSGLYLANADGSGEPIYLGPGNNPVWTPDGSGVVYDHTRDDGHILVSGDIYYSDSEGTERTNLTEGEDLLGQGPSVGPDGETVMFESDGEIYVGVIQ